MKKGFTLIEVIGAIVILGLISLIAIPTLLNVVKNKEKEMNEVTKQLIYTASSQYTTKYENIFKKTIGNNYCVTIKDLVINNFLTEINTDDINLDTKIKVTIDNNKKYKYEIDNNCEPTQLEQEQLTISITTDPGIFNELGWSKEDFYVSIIGNGTSYKWCSTTDGECTPNEIVGTSSGSSLIDTEGTNVVCAQAINETNESEMVCSDEFKLDKTKPEITDASFQVGDKSVIVIATYNDNLSDSINVKTYSSIEEDEFTFDYLPASYGGEVLIATPGETLQFLLTDEAGNIATYKGVPISTDPIIAYAGTTTCTCLGGCNSISNEEIYTYCEYASSCAGECNEDNTISCGGEVTCYNCSSGTYYFDGNNRKCLNGSYKFQIVE